MSFRHPPEDAYQDAYQEPATPLWLPPNNYPTTWDILLPFLAAGVAVLFALFTISFLLGLPAHAITDARAAQVLAEQTRDSGTRVTPITPFRDNPFERDFTVYANGEELTAHCIASAWSPMICTISRP